MKLIKKTAIALALSAMSFAASAMTSIDDASLSQVSGQDGVSIVADLNMNIGSFTYTDKSAGGNASVAFENIGIRGGFLMTIDVLNANAFAGAAIASLMGIDGTLTGGATGTAAVLANDIATALGKTAGSDVVQFAFPVVGNTNAHNQAFSVTVGDIRTGNGGASFGSVALNKIDLQGTKVWMFGH